MDASIHGPRQWCTHSLEAGPLHPSLLFPGPSCAQWKVTVRQVAMVKGLEEE